MPLRDDTQLRIAITSFPMSTADNLKELNLIKAALLYADRATLQSYTPSLALPGLALRGVPIERKIPILKELVKFYGGDKGEFDKIGTWIEAYEGLAQTVDIATAAQTLRMHLADLICDAGEQFATYSESVGATELRIAIDSGLLEVKPLDALRAPRTDLAAMRALATKYFDDIIETIEDRSVYPLFDEYVASSIVGPLVESGALKLSDVTMNKTKPIALAGQLFGRLPLFEEASMKELLDIRKELSAPLVRFRSSLLRFSEKIKSAPWDIDFSVEAEQVLYRDIEPVVTDLEEQVRANRYLSSLTRKLLEKPVLAIPAGSVLALALSNATAIPGVISQAIGIGLGTANVAYEAYKEWSQKQQAARNNNLFFYFRAKQVWNPRQPKKP